jgi:hypothetical protein
MGFSGMDGRVVMSVPEILMVPCRKVRRERRAEAKVLLPLDVGRVVSGGRFKGEYIRTCRCDRRWRFFRRI